jgi:hypothetical protein
MSEPKDDPAYIVQHYDADDILKVLDKCFAHWETSYEQLLALCEGKTLPTTLSSLIKCAETMPSMTNIVSAHLFKFHFGKKKKGDALRLPTYHQVCDFDFTSFKC